MNLDQIVCAVEGAVRKAQRGLVVGCLLATLLTVAFGFATAALYLALAAEMKPVYACLVVAGAYLVVAIIVLLLGRSGNGSKTAQRPPPPPERPGLEPDAVSQLIATFLAGMRAGREGFGRRRR